MKGVLNARVELIDDNYDARGLKMVDHRLKCFQPPRDKLTALANAKHVKLLVNPINGLREMWYTK